MTIKDILVGIAIRDDADPARNFALSMGEKYRAHVTGVAYGFVPDLPFSIYPEFVSDLAQQVQHAADKAVEGARAKFEEAALTQSVEHSKRSAAPSNSPCQISRFGCAQLIWEL
jgi:nucleotide-binding universal stress UspA family protein